MTTKTPRRLPRRRLLAVPRIAQPDEVSCGPTCLAKVLASYGDPRPVPSLVSRLRRNPDGGTQAVYLAHLAMDLGYKVRLYPFGVRNFDPTWWELPDHALIGRLDARHRVLQAQGATDRTLDTLRAWRDLLVRGGKVEFVEPGPKLLVGILAKGRPVICGLSASWLYRESRERPHDNVPDDLAGEPVGHFVVVRGYTGGGLHFHVADPADDLPGALPADPAELRPGEYPLPADRLIHAVLLGDTTGDAVLLEIWPARPRS